MTNMVITPKSYVSCRPFLHKFVIHSPVIRRTYDATPLYSSKHNMPRLRITDLVAGEGDIVVVEALMLRNKRNITAGCWSKYTAEFHLRAVSWWLVRVRSGQPINFIEFFMGAVYSIKYLSHHTYVLNFLLDPMRDISLSFSQHTASGPLTADVRRPHFLASLLPSCPPGSACGSHYRPANKALIDIFFSSSYADDPEQANDEERAAADTGPALQVWQPDSVTVPAWLLGCPQM